MNQKQGPNSGMRQRNGDGAKKGSAQELLRASELKYRRLFETAKDGILILDAETGTVVDVNPFLIELLGYPHDVFLGKRVWELGFLRDAIANEANFATLQQKGYIRYEDLPLQTIDGRQVEVEFVCNVYLVNDHRIIQCNIRDIAERKNAEKRLQQHQQELKKANEELVAFNSAMVGRELRMIELKKEIDKLCRQFGLPPRYGYDSD
jgi:PAS domain S-box-containing protein